MRRCLCDRKGQNVSRTGDRARPGQGLVYQAAMPESAPTFDSRGIARRILPLAAIIVLVGAAYLASGGVSLESLVPHRAAIDDFVLSHRLLAVLSYIVTVAHSVPGAVFLTVTGGFLFGLVLGASAAVINATIGATLIFLVSRGPHGARRPLLRRAGPRAHQLARGFREDAFSYLLFLRLVPAVPFFLVNLAPASPVCGLGRSTPRPRSVLSREPSSSLLRRSGWTA